MLCRTHLKLSGALLALLCWPLAGSAESQTLIEAGSASRYLANNNNPGLGTGWTAELFDDNGWTAGTYGMGYETGSGGAVNLLQTTVPTDTRSLYSRSSFTVTDASAVSQVTLGVDYDDGYVAWINGVEVFRSAEMPAGALAWNTQPGLHESSNGTSPDYTPLRDISTLALPVLHNGTNVLAIGAWNRDGTSSDLVLVPQLSIDTTPGGGTGIPLFEDNFNDGNTTGWSVVDDCSKGTSSWSVVNAALMQTGACRGYNPEGIATGTTLLTDVILPASIDIHLRLRAQDPDLDATTANDGGLQKYGAMGVEFGYQDSGNYYRFELSGIKGQRRLWRNQGGSFTELNSSPQSYVRGQWVDLRILHQNGVIIVFADGQQIMAATDNVFTSGRLALFCARNVSCSFDDIVVDVAPTGPVIGLSIPDGTAPAHASSEYFVDRDGVLDVTALSTQTTGVGGVEFTIDAGTAAEISTTDLALPYSAQFVLPPGEHTVSATLLDSGAAALTAADASAAFPQVGSGGIHLACLGDSITAGLTDDIALDDTSADKRNTGGGYEPVLNNYLSAANGVPVTVLNEGIPGEKSSQAAARIGRVLDRFPEAGAVLVSYGTNDSSGSMPLASGLGLATNHPDYPGSYKDYMQQIIDAVLATGKRVYPGKIPAHYKSSRQDGIIQSYNQVIDELMDQLTVDYPADYAGFTPPDMHSYFTNNPAEIGSDGIHPNGAGYQSMARLWCEALNGQPGMRCLDDDGDGLLNATELLMGTDPALADTDGDGLVDGSDGQVLLAAVSGGIDNNGDGYADGEQGFGTDPLQVDSDGDRLDDGLEAGNGADPLDPDSWPALADGDIAPLGNPDGAINAGDILIGLRLLMGLELATALELAHGDLYPPGSPDGVFNLQDMILLQQLP